MVSLRDAAPFAVIALAACSAPERATAGSTSGAGGASSTSSATSTSASAGGGGAGGSVAGPAACNRGLGPPECRPFGMALTADALGNNAYFGLIGATFEVMRYRPPPVFLDQFAADPGVCARCDAAAARQMKLVLAVRNDGGPLAPTSPPASLDAYRKTLGDLVDRYTIAYPGALEAVAIEDEVDAHATYYDGTAADYLAELAAACEVAHAKGVRCTDSGLSSRTMMLLLADYYEGGGDPAEALRLLAGATANPDLADLFHAALNADAPATDDDVQKVLAAAEGELDEAKTLLAGYPNAGVDYANFHWLEHDEDALNEVIAFLRSRSGCNNVVTTSIGQRDASDGAETLYKMDDTRELGLPVVVWSSEDSAESVSLINPDGTLRPAGVSFAAVSAAVGCGD